VEAHGAGTRRLKKKLTCVSDLSPAATAGRGVYNRHCYFCHGYDGNAETAAAAVLDPQPRDFTRVPSLDRSRIVEAVRKGRDATAMKPFGSVLTPAEIDAVADFVETAFVSCGGHNTIYHTAENGWPDHLDRYGPAVPFATGELAADMPDRLLDVEGRAGRRLFRTTCVSCHEGRLSEPVPLALKGSASRPDGEAAAQAETHDSDEYEVPTIHDVSPAIERLTEDEAAGRAIYLDACAECHAADGTGQNWIGTFLRPSPTDFTAPGFVRSFDAQLFVSKTLDPTTGTTMPSFRRALTEPEASAVAAYVARAFLGNGARKENSGTD